MVTTNRFTRQARELAERLDVKLVDGDARAGLIDEHEAADLVDDYLAFVTTADDPPAGGAPTRPDGADGAGEGSDTDYCN